MELSGEQKLILEKCNDGKNVFLTGPGGSGKTMLIKHIVENAKMREKNCQVCALTGCAAVILNCSAKTLHSWGGLGLAKGDINDVVNKTLKNRHKRKNWNKVEVLIVDEVSMLSHKLLIILDLIAKSIKKSDAPFGGIQVIFSGDFYQLPPIGSAEDPQSAQFCFEYEDWNKLFEYQIRLTKIFRQSDPKYSKILNEIRIGEIRKSSCKTLEKYIRRPDESDEIKPPIILSRRRDVENINIRELEKLVTEPKTFKFKEVRDITSISEKTREMITERDIDDELAYIKNNIMAEPEIIMKVGAQVMCIANIDMEGENQLVNGSQGIVIGFNNEFPIVQFRNGDKRTMVQHMWPSEKFQEIGIMQVPLIHAWAITIHKSQGATLDAAQIDIGSNIFECGQTYVALSRIKSLDGLYLIAFNPSKIKIYKKVEEFYKNLVESVLV
jgi:ATP-dependent DNA helicase PIF1